jgi:HD-GYP domain-containing protein (c-di-GMP phosphodiesterase class II)/CHASE2 domain-containing sensor protein
VPKIAIIGITDEDMKLLGRWPWPRNRYAETLDYLKDGGASVVAFDMFFDLPDVENPKNDKILSDSAKDAGMVIFPVWSATSNLFGIRPVDGLYKGRLNENIEIIAEAAEGVGHLNVFYDNDGVARRTPIQIADSDGRRRFVPLSLAIFLKLKGINREMALYPGHSLKIGDFNIPLDSKSCIPINYINFEKQIHIHQSANIKWLEKIGQEKPITLYSFSDVSPRNENRIPAVKFKDKLVLIGIATPGSEQDVHVTPFGRKFGIFIQANLLYNFLTGRLISIPGNLYTILIFTGLSVIFGILIFRIHIRGSAYLLLAGGLLLLFIIISVIMFTGLILLQRFNIMIDIIPFVIMSFMLTGTCLTVNLSSASSESAMRDLQLNLLLEVGEITTSKDESKHYSLKCFHEDIDITSALAIPSKPPVELLEPIKRITHCEATALYILDDETKDFAYTASTDLDRIKVDSQRIAGVVNKWIQSDAKPVWIDNVSRHPDLSLTNNNSVHSFLAVPLIVKKQTIGILYLYNKLASKISPFAEFTSEELRLISSFTHQLAIAIENHRLYIDIHNIFLDYIKSIAAALDARDTYTHGHSRRVAEFSIGIGKELGLSEGELEFLELSATVHDIGKIGISESILNKPDRLTDEEFEIIKSHVVKGSKILEPMSRLRALMPGVRHHHERYDGKGYPDGLKGDGIHLVARIISIADTFDAMTSDRVYRKSMSQEAAVKEIEKGAGTQFDHELVTAFVSVMQKSAECIKIEQ